MNTERKRERERERERGLLPVGHVPAVPAQSRTVRTAGGQSAPGPGWERGVEAAAWAEVAKPAGKLHVNIANDKYKEKES